MGLLDTLRGPVGRLLTTFGTEVTLRTFAEAYDPSTGSNIRSPTNLTVSALVEDFPASVSMGGEVSGGGVRRGDKKVTIAGAAVTAAPTTEDQVVIGGATHSIVKVDTQLGTDEAVTYTLQARR